MDNESVFCADITVDDFNPRINKIQVKKHLVGMLVSELMGSDKVTISPSDKQPSNGLTKYDARVVILSVEEYENLIKERGE